MRIAYLFAFLLVFAGCSSSTSIHKDFLTNLLKDSKSSDGSFKNRVVSLTYNDKGKYLVVGRESGQIDIWDAKEPQSKRVIKAHDYRASWITFASDGDGFFSSSPLETSTKFWSAKTGELLHYIPNTRGPTCATSGKDIYLVAQSSQIRFFDLQRQVLLPDKYELGDVILTMAMDAASPRIAVGTASGTIEIFMLFMNNGKPSLQKVRGAKPYPTGDWVLGLQFAPDGGTLYSVARSASIDQWAVPSLERKRTIPTTLGYVYSVAFLPGAGFLALGGTQDRVGLRGGSVELVSLTSGTSARHSAKTNLPVVVFLPPLATLISAQSRSMEAYPLTVK